MAEIGKECEVSGLLEDKVEKERELFAGRDDYYDLMSDASGEGSEVFEDDVELMKDQIRSGAAQGRLAE